MNAVPRIPRGYTAPILFSYGFRPFFLAGSAWAAIAVLLWLLEIYGILTISTGFTPRDRHIHELLYGYLAAVVAGFLLTAIPNWTGRLPVAGVPLAVLLMLWLVGRIAVLLSATAGAVIPAIIDVGFLLALTVVTTREVVAGRNWRNLRVLAILLFLTTGNVMFHIKAAINGFADYGIRVGLASAIGLIMLIGGRIVPSFTHNFLRRQAMGDGFQGRFPHPFSRFDATSIAVGAIALASWIVWPSWTTTGGLLFIAGALHVVRLARWAGERTVADRLVLVLHVGYSFVPIGFLLTGITSIYLDLLSPSAGVHAWSVGAIGMMTLAVMTRATLGHTGQQLAASRATEILYALGVVAALARIGASIGYSEILMPVAGLAWIGAFGGFVLVYGPMLLSESRAPVGQR